MLTGEIFVDEGLVTQDQLQQAVFRQLELGGTDPIAKVMVEMGLIAERDRVRCLGKVWGIPFIDVKGLPVREEVAQLMRGPQARKFKALPLDLQGKRLLVAMANPLDVFVIDEIRMATGYEIEPLITIEDDLVQLINDVYQDDTGMTEMLAGVMADVEGDLAIREEDPEVSAEELKRMGEDAPIIRLANLIINQAVADRASDIHLEPRKDGMVVRLRIDGVMNEAMRLPKKVVAPLTSRFKIVANMDIAEKRAPQDNRISAVIGGKEFDFRVSTLPVVYGEKIVMRVLDKGGISIGLAKLGFLDHNLRILEDLAAKSYGICLVTGPTGSGKSTTLYSLLNQTNDGQKNIITIEDPVEYELSGINQCNVNVKAGMTFAAGLRAMLRQDPDVIMVGEMRDTETATIAMEAALTGHLVFSTLHTNDAPSAPTRLIDMDVEPFLISSSINGVLAQRLVRQICPNCKDSYKEPIATLQRFGLPIPEDTAVDENDNVTIFKGRGCDLCKGSGHKGRTGVHELMVMTDQIRDEVLRRSPSHILRNLAIDAGMRTLQMDAAQKIISGVTSVEEVLRVIYA
ncbi:MAG: Flp pilus assembly complex ATPase component TadA [Fimbriimonadaceae bacterium]|nr:Flp pilus assembly complex ATPase component TadA [Fimbriimonadaceae bacterium]QYK54728.1 MAG: Flp pilus assembly complex ATPase component TadA [Fimbriimonadaceae bacterium]